MRFFRLFAALTAFAVAAGAAATDHLHRWFSGEREFIPLAAWVAGPSPFGAGELTIFCDVGGAALIVGDGGAALETLPGVVAFTVDGARIERPGRFDGTGADPGWTIRLDAELTAALSRGTRVDVAAQRMAPMAFGLRGSSAAIGAALAGCPPPPIAALAPPRPPALQPTAGPLTVETVVAHARRACGREPAFGAVSVFQLDFDGDGAADFLLNWNDITCPGAPTVGQQRGAGWRLAPHGDPAPVRILSARGEIGWSWSGGALAAR